jgi:hypothetical protein
MLSRYLLAIRNHLRRHWFFTLVQFSAIACLAYWWRNLPVPGYAIGVLALLAAVMSIHAEMRPWQKAVWMVLFGAFLFVEFRAIDKDRAEYAAAERAKRAEEQAEFARIANGINATLTASDKQFAATMGRTDQVLKNITGGESFAVVIPILGVQYPSDSEIPLAIENHGTNILTGVSVTLYTAGIWMGYTHQSILRSIENRVSVGTLHPGERLVLNRQIRPEEFMHADVDTGPEAGHFYRVFAYIAAQNFTSVQNLDFEKNPENRDRWLYRYKVYRQKWTVNKMAKTAPQDDGLIEQVDWSSDSNNPIYKH